MLPRNRTLSVLAVTLVLSACTDESATTAVPMAGAFGTLRDASATTRVDVMTRNLYIGADVFPVFAALTTPNQADDLPAILAGLAEFQETAFPARAAAIADEIARTRPHVAGLQEVSLIDIVLPAPIVPGGVNVQADFLMTLNDALSARGLNYSVASGASFFGVSLTPAPGARIRVIDRDLLLIDADRVSIVPGTAFAKLFAFNAGTVSPALSLTRGFVGARLVIDGIEVAVVNTHLEAGSTPAFTPLRAAQAAEIASRLASEQRAIILGDLNEQPGSPMYNVLMAAGFKDVWSEMRPGVDGFTCCHASNLANTTAVSELTQRIDYVMTRGLVHRNGEVMGTIDRIGDTPGERVSGPTHFVWPSDHAGVAARIQLPPR